VCEKPAVIVTKVYLVPVENGSRRDQSNYTAHMDVGKCCADKAINLGQWQKRKKRPPRKRTVKK
jgi:hypothetical protein